uniref:Uncharacterized protein n=1 Tax=Oryzias latipes TaxID=8090 RepID=A0A3B3H8B2_ORYLA
LTRTKGRSRNTLEPAMNMPMSGMNTRIPFPASAPITLQTNRKQSTKTYRKQTTNAVIWRNSCRLLEQERDPLQYRTLLFSCLYPLSPPRAGEYWKKDVAEFGHSRTQETASNKITGCAETDTTEKL